MEYHMDSEESSDLNAGRTLRERPPRYINLFTKLSIILGGFLQQMGWAFFGFGMIFFWVFVMNSEARYLLAFDGKWVNVQGTVLTVNSTSSEVNDQRIYAYEFRYLAGDETLEASSYDSYRPEIQVGKLVAVQYKSGNHKRARIEGMSSSTFPVWVAFACVFPLFGFFMIIGGLLYNIKALKLLIYGQFSKGKMIDKTITGSSVNNNYVYKYIFEFAVGGSKYQAKCSTYQTWKVEDEAMEIILYDKSDPNKSIVYDAIAGVPEITPDGRFDATPLRNASLLILPIVAIGLNILAYYLYSIFTAT